MRGLPSPSPPKRPPTFVGPKRCLGDSPGGGLYSQTLYLSTYAPQTNNLFSTVPPSNLVAMKKMTTFGTKKPNFWRLWRSPSFFKDFPIKSPPLPPQKGMVCSPPGGSKNHSPQLKFGRPPSPLLTPRPPITTITLTILLPVGFAAGKNGSKFSIVVRALLGFNLFASNQIAMLLRHYFIRKLSSNTNNHLLVCLFQR